MARLKATEHSRTDAAPPPAAMTTPHHLSELRIQHFRSFGTETTLRFRRGFNVVVGANGTGKSNCLDAALFALGQEAAQMRCRSWTELTSRARGGPCAVTVKLSRGTAAQADDVLLMAHVKDESSRVLRLNGTVASVQASGCAFHGTHSCVDLGPHAQQIMVGTC